jgi:hypothetical protein
MHCYKSKMTRVAHPSLNRMQQIHFSGVRDDLVFAAPDTGNFAQGRIGSQS